MDTASILGQRKIEASRPAVRKGGSYWTLSFIGYILDCAGTSRKPPGLARIAEARQSRDGATSASQRCIFTCAQYERYRQRGQRARTKGPRCIRSGLPISPVINRSQDASPSHLHVSPLIRASSVSAACQQAHYNGNNTWRIAVSGRDGPARTGREGAE